MWGHRGLRVTPRTQDQGGWRPQGKEGPVGRRASCLRLPSGFRFVVFLPREVPSPETAQQWEPLPGWLCSGNLSTAVLAPKGSMADEGVPRRLPHLHPASCC